MSKMLCVTKEMLFFFQSVAIEKQNVQFIIVSLSLASMDLSHSHFCLYDCLKSAIEFEHDSKLIRKFQALFVLWMICLG